MSKKQKSIFLVIIVLLIGIEQFIKYNISKKIIVSKVIIENFLKISFVKNTGGAFGIGSNNTWFFIIVNLIIIISIIYIIFKKKVTNKTALLGSALALAGGTSNMLDRIFRGYVVDYIDINDFLNYPVFNLADMFIVIGIIIIGIYLIIKNER